MQYQDFSSDENFVSSEDKIFYLSHVKISRLSWLLQSQPMKFVKVICPIAIIFRIQIFFDQNSNVHKMYILLH